MPSYLQWHHFSHPLVLLILLFGLATGCQSTPDTQPDSHYEESSATYDEPTSPQESNDITAPEHDQAPETLQFDDDELDRFARAYIEVINLQTTYQPQLQAAESEVEAQELITQINFEVEQALARHNLTPQEFETIAQALPTDPALSERVQKRVTELQ